MYLFVFVLILFKVNFNVIYIDSLRRNFYIERNKF